MAFEENVKRAHLQATTWKTALYTDPPDMDSYDYVWLKDHFKSLQPKTIPHDQLTNLILRCGAAAHLHNLDVQFYVDAVENKAASIKEQ